MASSQTVKVNNSGIGLFGALTILFIALKLMGYIHWSWWLVTIFLWGPILFLFIIFIIATLLAVAAK